MKLTLTIDDELAFLDTYRLTPNELMFIKTLFVLQEDGEIELFSKYIKILKQSCISIKELIISLQDKGIILKSYKVKESGSEFDPNLIPLNKNFIKSLYKASFEMGKELFDTYPQFGIIQGSQVSLRSISKKFNSLEDAFFKYGKYIGWNKEKHNYILELINWAKDLNIINFSLASFIIDNRWLDLEAMKNDGSINYNTMKLI